MAAVLGHTFAFAFDHGKHCLCGFSVSGAEPSALLLAHPTCPVLRGRLAYFFDFDTSAKPADRALP